MTFECLTDEKEELRLLTDADHIIDETCKRYISVIQNPKGTLEMSGHKEGRL